MDTSKRTTGPAKPSETYIHINHDSMDRIIFLDFDGVLNTEKYQTELRGRRRSTVDTYGPKFDPEAVLNLQKILHEVPDAKIVIESSWKLEGLQWIKDMWVSRELPGSIYDITPDYLYGPVNINLETIDDFRMLVGKGNEIRQWLFENEPTGCNYVILDDVPDFLPEQEEHVILTNPTTGLTDQNAAEAIRILKI